MTLPISNKSKRFVNRTPTDALVATVYDADGNIVANCPRWLTSRDRADSFSVWKVKSRQRAVDHATVIVRSCNAYPILVDALRKIQKDAAMHGLAFVAGQAEAALARVGE